MPPSFVPCAVFLSRLWTALRGMFAAVVVVASLVTPAAAITKEEAQAILRAEERAITRMNLAARQRYLVQKVSKATCFAMTAYNAQENAAQALLSLDTFDESFVVLLEGSDALGIAPETDPSVGQALAQGQRNWETYQAATRQIVAGDWHTVPMAQILRLDAPVLAHTNASVDRISDVHIQDLDTQRAYAATVNIAGRQRMLSQKAAKEMCYISLGINEAQMRAGLADTVELFSTSLYALANGDFDMSVIDPPSLAVLVKVDEVQTLWDSFRVILDDVIDGAAPTSEQMAQTEGASRSLFELSDALVQLYLN